MLKLENVSKVLNDNKILNNISLEISEGEIVGLIGKSGSGKSSLLRSVAGLSGIDGGLITYKNEIISSEQAFKAKSPLSSEIGMVFQHFNLFNHWNVLENVYKTLVLVKKISKETALQKAKKALEQVGLANYFDRSIGQLSGGQKQRVAIARTLAMESKLILFDEATSALDPESSKEIMKLMIDLKEKYLVTMIIVSHELSFIRDICDRVYFMENGIIVEENRADIIFSKPKNKRTQEFLKDYII
ncbi:MULTISPECIES: amino acid ABC transporter ATP-binding protein [unclassified Gemella]|uniref:amino acid ABC transporter ATP-binding protein n=1 Tax=unclassified Gemella TaxID=2624949 RepID=UPI001C04B628|nr:MULTISPECIES: amino acid ABC transporter ATP-binding protein [unclassified Gemella]MBU0278989.1 amino acid ABC transporter ATP-binding protein [Gemella sp. zg-1178]QWQ38747.1 amino acid ABC transporter ATP-binding protein [Gemella sp. zg-570]